ncbi:MAG: response regulator transcription factor [Pirellulales bacterium]
MDGALLDEHANEGFDALVDRLERVPLLVLDDDIRNGRLAAVLKKPGTGYFTRHVPFEDLADGIETLVRGERAFGSTVKDHVHQTPHGWQFRKNGDTSLFASLTPRELEVLRLVALGHSIKHCAEVLALAPSTVDNHKARLMKKLGVHKSLDLTRLAIREGLVSV